MHTRVCMSFYYICTVKYLNSIWDISDVSRLHQISKIYILLDLRFEVRGGRHAYPRLNLLF